MMVTSDELKWVDIGSLPPGAKLAVIEGPLNQAGPVTFRLKFPANYQIPAHWHPGDRTRHGDLRYVQHGNRR